MQSQPTVTGPSLLVRQGPIFLVGLGHGATHWVAATFYLLLPFINRDLGLSYSQAGLLVSIFHIASVGANFGSGPLVDVTGRRVLFQILALVLGGGALRSFAAGAGFVWLAGMLRTFRMSIISRARRLPGRGEDLLRGANICPAPTDCSCFVFLFLVPSRSLLSTACG